MLLPRMLDEFWQMWRPTTPSEFWQMVSATIIACALAISFFQFRKVRRQVSLSQQAQRAQSAMEIVKQLTSPEVKAAGKQCNELWERVCNPRFGAERASFSRKPFGQWDDRDRAQFRRKLRVVWTPADKEAIIVRSNAFEVAAIFIQANLVDEKVIVDNWGFKIGQVYELAGPLIEEARELYGTGGSYWDGFEWLARRPSIQVKRPESRRRWWWRREMTTPSRRTLQGVVVWLTEDQGGRISGPPDSPYAGTAYVPPQKAGTGLTSFVVDGFESTAWRSPADGRWLAVDNHGTEHIRPGAVVVIAEGDKPVGYFHVHKVSVG